MQVDYDRNAAKRTNVIDDQSDFFEIDFNAWLSDEVSGALQLFTFIAWSCLQVSQVAGCTC